MFNEPNSSAPAASLSINAQKVLAKRYLLHDEAGQLTETPSQLFLRVARTMAEIEKIYKTPKKEIDFLEDKFFSMMNQAEFLPNTPALINAGARLRQLAACFVVDVQDNLKSIDKALITASAIHQSGGGTGFSFSRLRPKGDPIRSTGGKASGPVSFMKVFDQLTDTMKQGGVRRGANMGVLRVDHPDILDFIRIKKDPEAMQNFNLSVAVTDRFMKAVADNGTYALINPRTGLKTSVMKARDVFKYISQSAWETGDPGLIFIDEINRRNPTRHFGIIEATNPCGEVPLHPWESCNLGSINLSKFVDGPPMKGLINFERLREAVRYSVRFLDNMIDASVYPLHLIEKVSKENRRIGLGLMGFAEALIMIGIPYNSGKALKTAEQVARFVEKESVRMSRELGRMRGSFPHFKKSSWYKKGFKHMRNATTTAIAPTGTISIIAGCSSGIEPLFAVAFLRNVMEGTLLFESNYLFELIAREKGFYSKDLLKKVARTGSVKNIKIVPPQVRRLFVTALEIGIEWHVKMQAAFQKHCHAAVSKTINLPKNASLKDVRHAYRLAWKLKCKGIAVYRYGCKAEQVLSVGSAKPKSRDHFLMADSEFAGGCPGGVCSKTTT